MNLDQVLKWSVLGKINYVRPQEERHGKIIPKREDTTVILVPHLSHVCHNFTYLFFLSIYSLFVFAMCRHFDGALRGAKTLKSSIAYTAIHIHTNRSHNLSAQFNVLYVFFCD